MGAGTVTITATQNGNSTYAGATPVVRTLTVAKAPLAVAGVNATRIYGSANPPLTYIITGFVAGDTQRLQHRAFDHQAGLTARLSGGAGHFHHHARRPV